LDLPLVNKDNQIFLLSNISMMTTAIRTIIQAMTRITPAIIPPRKFILSWLFAPTNGMLPANTPMLTGVFPKL
jgi:hypothetical protein